MYNILVVSLCFTAGSMAHTISTYLVDIVGHGGSHIFQNDPPSRHIDSPPGPRCSNGRTTHTTLRTFGPTTENMGDDVDMGDLRKFGIMNT